MRASNKFINLYLFGILFLSLLFSTQVNAQQAAVASAHPLATDAGIEILQQGGNAFDAAIAVTATLAVVEPYSSGIGGGGFWLLHIKDKNRDVMIDGREVAPLAATRDMYLDKKGEVIPGASINGPLSAGIPGVPAAIDHIAIHYGNLPLSKSLAAAIKYARDGFKTDAHYQRMALFREKQLSATKDAAEIFLNDGKPPEAGTLIVQTDLANTLSAIAKQGADGFYQGKIATRLVRSVKQHSGIWSMKDLSSYRVVERDPIRGSYKGMQIVSAAPPSSGGVAIMEMLNILSGLDYENRPAADQIHLMAESMRRAYRDRAEYLGDTDFVDAQVDKLVSREHANTVARDIRLDHATPSEQLPVVATDVTKATDTTHFSIIDKDGNRVAATLSINYPFGSCFVAEGTGVLLNDEMDDFSSKPGIPNVYGLIGTKANAIEPGKRMLSSMSPTFLETKDRYAVVGTPGGSRIITMVMLATMDFFQGGSATSMADLGRYHHQYVPDRIFYEPGVLNNTDMQILFERGHDFEELDNTYGNMQILVFDKRINRIDAVSDARGDGSARVID